MKLADIRIGEEYEVKIPRDVDSTAWHFRVYDGRPTYARVVEVGVHYDVPQYVTYGGLAGKPRVIRGYNVSARADGVRVEYERYGPNTVTVPCRNILWPRPEWSKQTKRLDKKGTR